MLILCPNQHILDDSHVSLTLWTAPRYAPQLAEASAYLSYQFSSIFSLITTHSLVVNPVVLFCEYEASIRFPCGLPASSILQTGKEHPVLAYH